MCEIGERIKRMRELSGISQNQLAKKAGIAQSTLSAIEAKTKSPSVDTVIMLAKALDCTVAHLIGEDDASAVPLHRSEEEKELVSLFDALNTEGRQRLLEYAQDMAQLAKWTKEKTTKAV